MRRNNRLTQALLLAGTAVSLSGCIAAAAIPIVAGAGGIVRSGVEGNDSSPAAEPVAVADGRVEIQPVPAPAPSPAPEPAPLSTPEPAMAPATPPEPTPVAPEPEPEARPSFATLETPAPQPAPEPVTIPEPEPEPAAPALATIDPPAEPPAARNRSEPVIVMTLADMPPAPTPAPAPTPDPVPEPEPEAATLAAAAPPVEPPAPADVAPAEMAPAPAPMPEPQPEPVELATAGLPAVPPSNPAPAPEPAPEPAAETLETAFADFSAPEPEPEAAPMPVPAELAAVEPEPAPAPAPAPIPEPEPEPVELAAAEPPVATPVPAPVPAQAPAPAPQQAELAPVDPPVAPAEMAPAVEPGQALVGYAALRSYALRTLGGGLPLPSAVLADPTTLQPVRRDCAGNSPTIVIDLDPAGGLVPLSGPLGINNALAGILRELRARDVNVAWITDRTPLDARAVRDRLVASGLDPQSRDSIYVERYPGETKQARRESIGQTSCIIAMAGDERADFDDLYNYLIDYSDARALEPMLGSGWFIIDNPVGE